MIAVVAVVMASCSKSSDAPQQGTFESITFKFGPDQTAIVVDQASKTIKNMPRSCDVTQLTAVAVLPSGYNISPDPSTAKDYSKGVTYTVTNAQGKSYTVQITSPVYDATNNPWGVYTPKHLSDIRNGLNDSYVLMNDIDLPNLNAQNAAASVGINDYSTNGWFSIGSFYVNGGPVIFRGSLDGQNHLIKNLTSSYRAGMPTGIDAGHNGKGFDGIFGYAIHASFKNIGIQIGNSGLNDMSTDGSGNAFECVGALVGRIDSSSVSNCFVTGNASISAGQQVGGLIGKAQYCTISKCYSSLTPTAGNAIAFAGDGGGLLGWALQCDISDCYSSSSVLGAVNAGGLVGMVNTCSIKTSYASGNVAELPMNTSSSLIPSNSLGGLIGTVSSISPANSTIQNCYSTGSVAGANGSNTSFHQGTRIGGLIGQIANTAGPVQVTFCYASGNVSRVYTSSTAPYLIGGLVGNTSNNVFITSSNCTNYWDKEKTGQTYLGGGNAGLATDNGFTANGKTTAEMKSQSTFVNWDFSSAWILNSSANNGYPTLRSIK